MTFLSSRSKRGTSPNPKAFAIDLTLSTPSCSTHSRENAVLHEMVSASISSSCAGQSTPVAFLMTCVVWGGL